MGKSESNHISIVIPAYNEEKHLPVLLDSINRQTVKPFEVIVSNSPRSTDKTSQIAKARGAKVVKGGNISEGRNHGANYATGEYIMFIDADTEIHDPMFIQKFEKEIRRSGKTAYTCYFEVNRTNDNLPAVIVIKIINLTKKFNSYINFFFGDLGTFLLVRRETFENLRGYDERLQYYEDAEFVSRLRKICKIKLVDLKIIKSGRRFNSYKRIPEVLSTAFISSVIVSLTGFEYNQSTKIKIINKLSEKFYFN